jgi:hypothetical protein
MKKSLTIGMAATALAATVSFVAAGPYQREPVTAADALPAYEILATVRALGFDPTTQAFRRGPYYVLHALDWRGVQVRVVADAQLGDIVSIRRVFVPRYDAGPRIIHVPQPGDRRPRRRSDASLSPPAKDFSPVYPTPKFGAKPGKVAAPGGQN